MRVIGASNVASIRFSVDPPVDAQWIHGHFQLALRDAEVGNWRDTVTLRGVANWWSGFAEEDLVRWDAALEGASGQEMYGLIYRAIYDESGEIEGAFRRFEISHLGMSAFDRFTVFLVEPPGSGDQVVLWNEGESDEVHEARLPTATLQRLGREFVEALEESIRALPESSPRGLTEEG